MHQPSTFPFTACLCCTALASLLAGCSRSSTDQSPDARATEPQPRVVEVRKPLRKLLRDKTTQPAIVHPYFEAKIFAKVSGYLTDLKVDIGDSVAKGALLAVIDVPDLEKRLNKQKALIHKLQAEEDQAAARVKVADATIDSSKALVAKARADIAKASAGLNADHSEYERMRQLAEDRSVSRRLLDEAKKRFEASQASVEATEADLDSAKQNVTVAQARQTVAQAELKTTQAQTDVARKALEETQAIIAFARLQAPFDGTVVARNVEPGDFVPNMENSTSAADPLFVIADLSKVRIRVPVPERDTPYVQTDAKATVDFHALRGRPIPATVTRIARRLDDNTRTMIAEIDLPNDKGLFLPGMFGKTTIFLTERTNCLTLPAPFVRYDEAGNSYVLVVGDDDKVESLSVRTGLDDGQTIEIVDGLQGNELVIAPAARRLKVGQKVRTTPD